MEQKMQPPLAEKPRRGKSDMTKIEQIRRKKHEKRLRTAALLVLLLAAVLAYVGGLFAPSINFLSELLDSAKIAIFPGEGWPIRNETDQLLNVESLSGGAAMLDMSDLILYSPTAKELRRVPHGYADPAMAVGNARVCIYNRSGTDLKVESRSRNLLSKQFERPILSVGISDGGAMAVATKSERYMAEITVYDPSFNEIYYCYLAEDYPMELTFASDGKRFAAACLKVEGGDFGTVLRLYNTRSEEMVTSIPLPGALPLEMKYLDATTLLVVSDRFTATYDCTTGAQIARYDYGTQTLLAIDLDRKNIALCFGDETRVAGNRCTVLDSGMQVLCDLPLGYPIHDVLLGSESLLILSEATAYTYDLTGTALSKATFETEGSFLVGAKTPLVVTAKEILQLIE